MGHVERTLGHWTLVSTPLELAERLVASWEDAYGSVVPRVEGHVAIVLTNDVRDHLRDDILELLNAALGTHPDATLPDV